MQQPSAAHSSRRPDQRKEQRRHNNGRGRQLLTPADDHRQRAGSDVALRQQPVLIAIDSTPPSQVYETGMSRSAKTRRLPGMETLNLGDGLVEQVRVDGQTCTWRCVVRGTSLRSFSSLRRREERFPNHDHHMRFA